MAGHSKWANIRFRKAAQDAKRGKLFTKLIREITISARTGGGDPSANPRLRTALDKALAANMAKDTVERATKRGTGELEGVNYEEIRYEGYAPGGTAVLVECQTDNRNRTVSEVRHAFSKHGGNLGTDGSVAYLFNNVGILTFSEDVDADQLFDIAASAGAEDVNTDDELVEVITAPDTFLQVQDALNNAGLVPVDAGIVQRASIEVALNCDDAEKVLKLLDTLEDLDDVQNVYTNAEFPDELLQAQSA